MLTRPDLADLTAVWLLLAGELGLFLVQPGWGKAIIGHLALIAALWVLGGLTSRPLLQVAALFSLGTGPFGAAIAVGVASGLRFANSDPEQHAEWYRLLSGAAFDGPPRSIAQELHAGRLGGYRAPPRQDLKTTFSTGTRGQKQAALRWLAQQELSAFSTELRLALDNEDNTIRIEAAALAGRLQNDSRMRPRNDPES